MRLTYDHHAERAMRQPRVRAFAVVLFIAAAGALTYGMARGDAQYAIGGFILLALAYFVFPLRAVAKRPRCGSCSQRMVLQTRPAAHPGGCRAAGPRATLRR